MWNKWIKHVKQMDTAYERDKVREKNGYKMRNEWLEHEERMDKAYESYS
jgi:hypothetical protein